MSKQSFFTRWGIFIKERFPLLSYLFFIIFYFTANALIALNSVNMGVSFGIKGVMSGVAILFIFFHLRIFDEIKDYKVDLKARTDRPLARGLITVKEARVVAFVFIFLELIIGLFIGFPGFVGACCMVLYSLIMYKEFFISSWLRPRLATYALTHTIVACWESLFIFSCMTGYYFWQISKEYGLFVFVNWMLLNIFEFGRKTFGRDEERELVDSYSKNQGAFGAAFNVLITAFVSTSAAFILGDFFNTNILFFVSMGLLFGILLIVSLIYVRIQNGFWGKAFRLSCSVFILFYDVIFTIGLLVWKH